MSGQLWSVDASGGFFSAKNLSKELREALQPRVKFRQLCDAKDATALVDKGKGAIFHWDIVSNVANQGGTLTETNTMPETQFTITQGTLTINEYGNSVPYSGKLEALSEVNVKTPIMKALKNDATKSFDIGAHAEFNKCLLRVVPTSGTATDAVTLTVNGTATGTNNVAFGLGHAKAVVDLMKERNIEPYVAEDYYAIGWPSTFRPFKDDLEAIRQYVDQGFQLIMNGEIGRHDNMRYVEQTHIPKGGAANSTTWNATTGTADAWDNAKSDWIFFMGADTVAEGIAVPEEIRAKIPTDYGRSKGVAWYALEGFGKVHQAATEERIIKWDSAV